MSEETKTNMSAIAVLGLINAFLALVEQLLPVLKTLNGGDITAEQQAALRARYENLRDNLDQQFSGPEWQVEP